MSGSGKRTRKEERTSMDRKRKKWRLDDPYNLRPTVVHPLHPHKACDCKHCVLLFEELYLYFERERSTNDNT